MAKINILDQDTINKIAAGEVVERPSSVVKELVENAIDAGATAISVQIENGGKQLIRITDNGSGFDPEDIPVAFLKNATSKIRNAEDLDTVMTLGFRGEALSSIAAVAKVELLTKRPGELSGIRYLISGGIEESCSPVGCPEGTTIIIRDLFFNTPVRRKFLKTDMTEAGYVNDVCERIALAHPEISLKFTNNGRQLISTTGSGKLSDAVFMIYGRSCAEQLLDVSLSAGDISISGVIARPVIARGNRNYENYFLNGRYIRNPLIGKAIEEAYKTYLMQNKYPFTVLSLNMPAGYFDVNVHPAKLEVRFTEPQLIYELVYRAVLGALKQGETISELPIDEVKPQKNAEKPAAPAAPEPFEKARRDEKTVQPEIKHSVEKTHAVEENKPVFEKPHAVEENKAVSKSSDKYPFTDEEDKLFETPLYINRQSAETPSDSVNETPVIVSKPEQLSFLSPEAVKEHRIIGQIFDTYWLVEYDEKLYIIDQHAAHERVLFENLVKEYKNGEVHSQLLYPAPIIELSLSEIAKLEKIGDKLKEFGYELEPFGGRSYRLLAVPEGLSEIGKQDLLIELIDSCSEDIFNGDSQTVFDKLASMSCKAAVKGNMRLSEAEAKKLIEDLLNLENPFHCPHGRPVEISFTKYEIEKKFKRIV